MFLAWYPTCLRFEDSNALLAIDSVRLKRSLTSRKVTSNRFRKNQESTTKVYFNDIYTERYFGGLVETVSKEYL